MLLSRFSCLRWSIDEHDLDLQLRTSFHIPDFNNGVRRFGTLDLRRICIIEKSSTLLLISDDRVLYELDIRLLQLTKDHGILPEDPGKAWDRTHRVRRIDNSGDLIMNIHITDPRDEEEDEEDTHGTIGAADVRVHVLIEVFHTTGAIHPFQSLRFDYASDCHSHRVKLSPDLSILRSGPHIFDLRTNLESPLPFNNSPLTDVEYDPRLDNVHFSACNRFMSTINDTHSKLELFEISRKTREFNKITVERLVDAEARISAANFHPFLPLIIVTYTSEPTNGDSLKDIRIVEYDLELRQGFEVEGPKDMWVLNQSLSANKSNSVIVQDMKPRLPPCHSIPIAAHPVSWNIESIASGN